MSHKRVVKKRGKTYGPYLYESYRDKNGKVKKRYLGKVSKHVEQKNKKPFIIPFIILSALLLLIFFSNLSLTGKATISIDDAYNDNGTLCGNMVFVLQQSEHIPGSTEVIILHADNEYSYSLRELIEEEETQGNFFVEQTTLNGSGSGFGLPDTPRFPPVSFVLGIYNEISSQSDSEPETPTNETDENQTTYDLPVEIPEEETNETPEEEPEPPEEETNESEPGTRTISGNIILNIINFFTGKASLELSEELQGEVRANESFVYDLENDQTAQIISSEQDIDLEIQDNQAIVTTNYTGNESRTIEISLDDLDISAEEGEVSVYFVYEGTELFSDTTQITSSAETRQSPVEEPENETEETNETITTRQIQATCTCGDCGTCDSNINDPSCDVIELTTDISISSGTCISPTDANNKLIDCKGFNITGEGTADIGIYPQTQTNLTIRNCTIHDFSQSGINFGDSSYCKVENVTLYNAQRGMALGGSENNSFTDVIIHNTEPEIIYMEISNYNNFTNLVAYNSPLMGIYMADSSYNNFDNFLAYNNYNVVSMENCNNNKIINSNMSNNNGDYGIYLYNSNNSIFQNNILSNTGPDITLTQNSLNNTFINQQISSYPTNISFVYSQDIYTGEIRVYGVDTPLSDPVDWYNISRYVNITNVSGTGPSWLFLNFSYDDLDISGLGESSLLVWRNNGTDWTNGGWNTTRIVDTTNNVVGVNVTSMGSVYAPLGEEEEINCTCVNCTDCITKLNNPLCPNVNLDSDITDYSGTCITFLSNHTILDCQGSVIDGDKSIFTAGIDLNDTVNNTIQNCSIKEFYNGVLISGGNHTLLNNTISNFSLTGIDISSSDYNEVINNTIYLCGKGINIQLSSSENLIRGNQINDSTTGVYIDGCEDNNLTYNIFYNTTRAIFLWETSYNNTLLNNEIYEGDVGIQLEGATHIPRENEINNNFINATNYALYFIGSENNTLANNTVYGGLWDWNSTENSTGNIIKNLISYNNNISFTSFDVAIKGINSTDSPLDESGYLNANQWINATNNTASSWLNINFSYRDVDIPYNLNESSLKIWKYDGSWTENGWNGTRVLDTTNNVVGVNITSFESTYAPLGDEVNIPPNQSLPILNSTTGNNVTSDNLTCYNQSTYDADGDPVDNTFEWYKNGIFYPTNPNDVDFNNVILHMPFENYTSSSDAYEDYTSYRNTGTPIFDGVGQWNATGGHDGYGAYEFDGSGDFINLTDHADKLIFSSPASISFWLKSPREHKTQSAGCIYSISDGNTGGAIGSETFNLYYGSYSGFLTNEWIIIVCNNGGEFGNGVTIYAVQDAGTYTNQWHHYVFTGDGSTWKMYIDGISRTLSIHTYGGFGSAFYGDYGEGISPKARAAIGVAYYDTLSGYFNGTIDDFRLYDVVLTQDQVLALYNETNKTSTLYSGETRKGETIYCNVTPYDGEDYGATNQSNILTILNSLPTHNNPILNSSSGTNLTSENLTCYNQTTADLDEDSVKNIYNWYKNGQSIMVLNMPFEPSGTLNATDYSPYSNNGTVNGNPVYNLTGGYDGKAAYDFDGSDYIEIADDNTLDFGTSDFSIEARFKADSGAYLEHSHIFSKQDPENPTEWVLQLISTTGEMYFRANAGNVLNHSFNYFDDTWHHVVVTRDSGTFYLYVDGDQKSSNTTSLTLTNANPLRIGRRAAGYDGYFKGLIDEVRIYNSSLSPEQISALYNNKTDLIVSQELTAGEEWNCSITPNDLDPDGETKTSGGITIQQTPSVEVIANSSSESTSVWRMYKRNFNRTSLYPDSINMTDFGMKWMTETTYNLGSPVVDDERIYANDGLNLSAYNVTNGNLDWSSNIETASSVITSTPAIANNGRIYVCAPTNPSNSNKSLFAYNATDGSQLWNASVYYGCYYASPLVYNNIVYTPGRYNLYAYNATNGNHIWNYTSNRLHNVYSSPVLENDIIYFGNIQYDNVYALNATDGTQVWNTTLFEDRVYPTSNETSVYFNSPSLRNDILYIAGYESHFVNPSWIANGYLFAINATNGTKIWNYTTSVNYLQSHVSIYEDGIYFPDYDSGYIYAVNATTGSELWTRLLIGNNRWSSFSITNDGIGFIGISNGDYGRLYALNLSDSGNIIYNESLLVSDSSPAIADDVVYVKGLNGGNNYLVAFNESGTPFPDYSTCPNNTDDGIWIIDSSTTISDDVECSVIIVNNSTILTVDSEVAGNRSINITAENITIEFGSSISADYTGYEGGPQATAGFGPGGGAGGAQQYSGGGGGAHGGEAGDSDGGAQGGSPYNYSLTPLEPGSGGGGGYYVGGYGGGAIRLIISDTFELNGTVEADGQSKGYVSGLSSSGAGAGGSIYVTANTLTGIGNFSATGGLGGSSNQGGGDGGSGAGGRIAVYFNESDLDMSTSNVEGSPASTLDTYPAQNGTLVFIDVDDNILYPVNHFRFQPEEVGGVFNYSVNMTNINFVTVGNITAADDRTITFNGSNFIMDNSNFYNYYSGVYYNLTILMNEIIVNSSVYNFGFINISTDNLTVGLAGNIKTDYSGHAGGAQATIGSGPGGGDAGATTFKGGGGGAYGGEGGDSDGSAQGGSPYDSALTPTQFGSGGGGGYYVGGYGGGAIRIDVSNLFTLDGTVEADGQSKGYVSGLSSSGAGAGGSIYVTANTLTGIGNFSATGGLGGSSNQGGGDGGSGAGGRIAVYFNESDLDMSTSNVEGSPASTLDSIRAENGTLVFIDMDDNILYPVNHFRFQPEEVSGAVFSYNIINMTNAQVVVGNVSSADRRNITLNTNNFIMDNSDLYNYHSGVYYNITIISNEMSINSNIYDFGLVNISTGNLTIGTDGSIDVDYNGYPGGTAQNIGSGPGGGGTCGGTTYRGSGGAGHGGYGGNGQNNNVQGGIPYNSSLTPLDFGSGGGGGYYRAGGNGGGAIRIDVSNDFIFNGEIEADGGNGYSSDAIGEGASGGGSGGSIYITTYNLTGNGNLSAIGGKGDESPASGGDSGSGAGGRIAVYYNESAFTGNYDISGGAYLGGGYAAYDGEPGTLIFVDMDDSNIFIYEGFRFQIGEFDGSGIQNTINITNASVRFENNTGIVINATNFNLINSNLTDDKTDSYEYIINANNIEFDSDSIINLDGRLHLIYDNFSDTDATYTKLYLDLERSNYGVVEWIPQLTTLSNISINTNINYNSIFVNSTAVSDLNTSANISIYINSSQISNYQIKVAYDDVNFENCTHCTEISDNEIIFKFNTTRFTTYQILGDNQPPYHIQNPILNSSSGTNTSSENLTCNIFTADADNEPIKNIINWYKDNISIMLLNMPFEGGSNDTWTKDYSTYGANGSVSGATWNATGGYDGWGAYSFDGDDYISIPHSELSFSNNSDFTVTFWVQDAPPQYETLIEKYSGSSGWFIVTHPDFHFPLVLLDGTIASGILQGSTALNDRYHFLALVIDWDSEAVLYIDGDNEDDFSGISNLGDINCTQDLLIGGTNGASSFVNLSGSVDDVKIYNRALSEEQIKALYANQTNLIVSQETVKGENWLCEATANDGHTNTDSTTNSSGNLTILNSPPTHTQNPILNSTYGTNYTVENLTCWTSATDADGDSVKNIYNWYKNGSSLMVLNMPFEPNSTTSNATDYSGYGNHGIVNGNPVYNLTGGYDGKGAYEFDGVDDYIDCGNDSSLNITGNFSISAWIYTEDGSIGRIADKRSANEGYILWIDANKTQFSIKDGGLPLKVSGNTEVLNDWYHVVGTCEIGLLTTTLRLYVNGVQDNSISGFVNVEQNPNRLTIGAQNPDYSLTYFFNGTIDDVQIYNHTLSAEQVVALYNNRTDLIVSQETEVGENWSCSVTPNDGIEDGLTNSSSNLTILETNCSCDSCSNCELKFDFCDVVTLVANISGHSGTCINNPINFENKIFDCGGNYIQGDTTGPGIYLASQQRNNTIQNCNISNFSVGMYFFAINETTIQNSVISNSLTYGIYLRGSSNNTLLNSNITDNQGSGIGIRFFGFVPEFNNITGNIIKNNSQYGIYLDSSSNNIIENNKIINNSNHGIHLYLSSDNNLTSINVSNNLNGINLDHSSDNNLTSINVFNNNQRGIYSSLSHNNTFASTNVYNNSQYGIYLAGSSDNNLTLVNSYDNTYFGILLYISCNNNNLTSINSYNNGWGGMYLESSSNNIITESRIHDNPSHGIQLLTSNENIIEDNNITNNVWDGIYLNSSDSVEIQDNLIDYNRYGIYIYNSSFNILDSNNMTRNTDAIFIYGTYNNVTNNDISHHRGSSTAIEAMEPVYTAPLCILTGESGCNGVSCCDSPSIPCTSGTCCVPSGGTCAEDNDCCDSPPFECYIPIVIDSDNIIIQAPIGPDPYTCVDLTSPVFCFNNFSHNRIYNATYGFVIGNTDNETIYNNTIWYCDYGIYFNNSYDCNIVGNKIYDNLEYGIYFYNSSRNDLIDNIIYNNSKDGIRLNQSSNNELDNITVYDNQGYDGISLYASSDYNLLSNIFAYDNAFDGIYLENSSHNVVLNLTAYNNTGDGIYVYSGSDNTTITNVSSTYNDNSGVYIDASDGCNINDIFARGGVYGVILEDSTNNNVTNITTFDNIDYGLELGNTTYTDVRDILSYNNSKHGLFLSSANQNNITNFVTYNNTQYGIYVYSSNNTVFNDNIVKNNTLCEIYLFQSFNNVFENQEIGTDYPTNISFIYSPETYIGNLRIKEVNTPPTDPVNYVNITKYVNITNSSGPNWLFLNMSYEDSSISGFRESTLKVWKYNETDWIEDEWNGTRFLDTTNNIIGVNITDFASVYSPLGGIHPPTHNIPLLNSTTENNYTTENLTVYNQSTVDLDGDSVKNIINWYKDNISIMLLNMPFEGGSNSSYTKDYSGFGNNGIQSNITAQPVWDSTGGYDGLGAYNFDGVDDYINTTLEFDSPGIMNMSFSLWAKFDSQNLNKIILGGVGYRGTGQTQNDPIIDFYISPLTNKTQFRARNWKDNVSYAESINDLYDGNWHYLVGVLNGNTSISIYVDGILNEINTNMSLINASASWNFTGYPFYLGSLNYRNEGSDVWSFNGTIDDVRIYNHTLSAEQIAALYANRTDLIVSQETSGGEVWKACITPNDGFRDGIENCSNNLTVLEEAVPPSPPGGGGGCTPDCGGKECGDDGCGGSCGTCSEGYECVDYQCVLICIENWICSEWGECINGTQNRICNDLNNCTTEFDKPDESRSCEVSCEENWICSWTDCAEGDEYSHAYDCVDLNNCGTQDDKPTQLPCGSGELQELLQEEAQRTGCTPEWICEDWGECEADYSLEEILQEDVSPMGVQRRECVDNTGCASPKIDKRPCELSVPITAEVVEWCEEDYVEIREELTNKLVSRVKEEKIGFTELSRIDISFITTEFTGYCDYCYDGVQNYDETGIDCGGPSCPECVPERPFFDWLFWLLVLLWGGLFIATTIRLLMNRKEILLHIKDYRRQKLFYLKGVEETLKGQRAPRRITPKPTKERPFGLLKLIRKKLKPYFGKPVTEAGISKTKPELKRKSYFRKQIKSYKEQKVKPKPVMKKIKEFFVKPKPIKLKKIKREAPGSEVAKKSISETKKQLRRRGF